MSCLYICNITLTKGSSLEWTDLRLALGNMPLIRNSAQQLKILQLYCNHLQLNKIIICTFPIAMTLKWSACYTIKTMQTLRSADKGMVNVGPSWFP